MANEEQVSIRLPRELLERAGKLVPKLAADPRYVTIARVTKAWTLRLAMFRGIEDLEAELSAKTRTRKTDRSVRVHPGPAVPPRQS